MHLVLAVLAGALVGGGATAGVMAATRKEPPKKPADIKAAHDERDDDEDAMSANASLVSSLQECNRRLTELGQKKVEAPPTAIASAAPAPSGRFDRGNRGGGNRRGALTPQDWERYAEAGAVPYRIPCLRDKPYVPSQREIDRLGLAPQDVDALKDAYAKSNERMQAQIAPLCASALGSQDAANKMGASACLKAIVDSARRESPDKMKEALTRVAEVNAGKRSAPASREGMAPVESLMMALTDETKKFESDLAAKLGPEDARRLSTGRGSCSEGGIVSASQDVRPPRPGSSAW
jgi:hypothetical protein